MLKTPIDYINNGEPLDQQTLNRYIYDVQENLEELFRLVNGAGKDGSVDEIPDTLALRDEYGTTNFTEPRTGTNPLRLNDSSVESIPSTVVMRDENGSIKLGEPTGTESPIRALDIVGFAGVFAADPGDDWVLCDGREVSRSDYKPLFDKVNTIYGSGDNSTTFNVPDLTDLLNVTDASSYSGSTIFGGWNTSFPRSGTAPSDGIIHAKTGHDQGVRIVVNGAETQYVSARDKYGRGSVSASSAVRKGDSYSVSGGIAYVRFLSVDVDIPQPSKINLPVNYYIRAR